MKLTRQWLRHSVQVFVLLLIIVMPMLAWFDANLDTGRVDRLLHKKPNNIQYSITSTINNFYRPTTTSEGGVINPANQKTKMHECLAMVRGNTWAAEIFGYSIIDPLAGVESLTSGKAVIGIILGGLCIPVVFTVLFGRVYCPWLCPAGFLFEVNQGIRRLLIKAGLPQKQFHTWRGHKYVLLIVGLVMSSIMTVPLLGYFYPPALIGREVHRAIFGLMMASEQAEYVTGAGILVITGVSVFMFILFMIELFAAERIWCRSLCPGGALYSILGRFRVIRMKRMESRCTQCTDCVSACPMGLNPMQDQFGMECDNCMTCITYCPDNSLKLTISFKDTHHQAVYNIVPLTTHAT